MFTMYYENILDNMYFENMLDLRMIELNKTK